MTYYSFGVQKKNFKVEAQAITPKMGVPTSLSRHFKEDGLTVADDTLG
jgi:hypothetical protein